MAGIEKIPIRWPSTWDPAFMDRVFREVLAFADTRNAVAGPGVVVEGQENGPATISVDEDIQNLASAAIVVTEPSDHEPARLLTGEAGLIVITDNGPGSTVVISMGYSIPIERLAAIPGLSVVGTSFEGDLVAIEAIESSTDHTVLRRIPNGSPDPEGDSALDWGKLTLEMAEDGTWTNVKLADMTGPTIKGRESGTGAPEDLTPTQVLDMLPISYTGAGIATAAGFTPANVPLVAPTVDDVVAALVALGLVVQV